MRIGARRCAQFQSARQLRQSLPVLPALLDFPVVPVDPMVTTSAVVPQAGVRLVYYGPRRGLMKIKMLLLAIAAIVVAAVPTPGRSQETIRDRLAVAAGNWMDNTSGLCSPVIGAHYAEDISCSDGT